MALIRGKKEWPTVPPPPIYTAQGREIPNLAAPGDKDPYDCDWASCGYCEFGMYHDRKKVHREMGVVSANSTGPMIIPRPSPLPPEASGTQNFLDAVKVLSDSPYVTPGTNSFRSRELSPNNPAYGPVGNAALPDTKDHGIFHRMPALLGQGSTLKGIKMTINLDRAAFYGKHLDLPSQLLPTKVDFTAQAVHTVMQDVDGDGFLEFVREKYNSGMTRPDIVRELRACGYEVNYKTVFELTRHSNNPASIPPPVEADTDADSEDLDYYPDNSQYAMEFIAPADLNLSQPSVVDLSKILHPDLAQCHCCLDEKPYVYLQLVPTSIGPYGVPACGTCTTRIEGIKDLIKQAERKYTLSSPEEVEESQSRWLELIDKLEKFTRLSYLTANEPGQLSPESLIDWMGNDPTSSSKYGKPSPFQSNPNIVGHHGSSPTSSLPAPRPSPYQGNPSVMGHHKR